MEACLHLKLSLKLLPLPCQRPKHLSLSFLGAMCPRSDNLFLKLLLHPTSIGGKVFQTWPFQALLFPYPSVSCIFTVRHEQVPGPPLISLFSPFLHTEFSYEVMLPETAAAAASAGHQHPTAPPKKPLLKYAQHPPLKLKAGKPHCCSSSKPALIFRLPQPVPAEGF